MTLHDYVSLLRERLVLFLAVVLATVLVALGVWAIVPSTYTAETTLFVSSRLDDETSQSFQAAQLTQQRVASYVALATGPRVIGEVATTLDPPADPVRVLRQITVGTTNNSLLVDVSATDVDPSRAARIADAVGASLSRTVDDLERPALPVERPAFALRAVAPAVVPVTPSSIGLVALLGLGLVVGLLIGLSTVAATALHVGHESRRGT